MSFGLNRSKELDPAVGIVMVSDQELPPLPDSVATDPESGRLDPRAWFKNPALPLELEIGSGKGTFLVQHAPQHPDTNFLGIEWAGEFAVFAADRVRRAALSNVRMMKTDATVFLNWRQPDASLHAIHLYFSDPWPKKKHHKKRVIQDSFLEQAHRTLIPGGHLHVVTDHDELWAWDCEHFDRWCVENGPLSAKLGATPAFTRTEFQSPPSAGEGEVVGTNFERKFRKEGRTFNACTLVRSG